MKTLIDVVASTTTAKKGLLFIASPLGKAKETAGKTLRLRSARRFFVLSEVEGQFPGSREPQTASAAKQSPRSDIIFFFFLLSSFILSSCASVTETPQMEIVSAYATAAARPWLTELYDCAANQSVVLRLTDSASDAAIYIRIGEPDVLMTPAYQIDTEELLIATHRESPAQNLTLEEARALFAGQGDLSMKVWVYSSDEDIQRVFEQAVMAGRSVSSSANLAVSPGQMSDVLNVESNAVGILPRHWRMGNVRDVYSVGTVPVLAIVKEEPKGIMKELVGCLQK